MDVPITAPFQERIFPPAGVLGLGIGSVWEGEFLTFFWWAILKKTFEESAAT